jgi:hypothetical protein
MAGHNDYISTTALNEAGNLLGGITKQYLCPRPDSFGF